MSAKTWLGSIAIAWVLAVATVLPAQAQSVEYYHTDALGSIVAVTDSGRRVLERREYEPFGAQLTPALRDGPGYTGHVSDAATGLSYMQQRYYDPSIGRFLSVDPVTADGNTGGNFNRYWYAANNPYKFTDPDGREIAYQNKKVQRAVERAEKKSAVARGVIGELRASKNVWQFQREDPKGQQSNANPDKATYDQAFVQSDGSAGSGSGGRVEINFSTEQVMIYSQENPEGQPEAVSVTEKIVHEAAHAVDMDRGQLPQDRTEREDNAKKVENEYRKEQGLKGERK